MPTNTLKDRLILVVDDEPRMIQFVRMNLEAEGARVAQARMAWKRSTRCGNRFPTPWCST